MSLLRRYRATGADLPFGDPLPAHGVAMEGYFLRVSDRERGRVVIALIGVNRGPDGHWATLGLASDEVIPADGADGSRRAGDGSTSSSSGVLSSLRLAAAPRGWADPDRLGARSGDLFEYRPDGVRVDLGPGARLHVEITDPVGWPRRAVGGSSVFQSVPALNQYWHPWLLGGKARGWAEVDGRRWEFDAADVYGEKNWGGEGFPDSWWWGQAQAFSEPDTCVAFAGGQVHSGPLRTEVTALVVRLPGGRVVRLGNPVVSPVRADVGDDVWALEGRGYGWRIRVTGRSPLSRAHVLPVPLPSEKRNSAGAIEHLSGELEVEVRRYGRLVWRDRSSLAALEHGGLDRAEAELRRRGVPVGETGAPPR
ncbi:tocopherol cyclase family protein [Dietzia sp. UBA5065]|uniref:tocopherol cyclase family protein n=1 Tax=Dietzia sp. UBA5065 TaxID=1946422 RepID=UPI0025B7ED76|nr:tocopherol cyclase family protein [Dietzia sp. UBA5065]